MTSDEDKEKARFDRIRAAIKNLQAKADKTPEDCKQIEEWTKGLPEQVIAGEPDCDTKTA